MQRKYIFLSGFFALLSLTALPLAGLTGDAPFCYIRDRFGRTVNLEGLCQKQRVPSSPEKNPLTVREVDQNSSVLLEGGTVVMNDGLSFRPVYQDGQIVREVGVNEAWQVLSTGWGLRQSGLAAVGQAVGQAAERVLALGLVRLKI